MMTASARWPASFGSALREANSQRPWWPLCSKDASNRLSHFSSVSLRTWRTRMSASLLDGLGAALAGADADAVLQRQDEDFAVADAALGAGAPGLHDGVDGRLDEVLVDGDLELHLAQQVDGQLVAAVDLGMALLATEALDVDDGQAEDLDLVKGLLDGLELGRLDNGQDQFHEGARTGDRGSTCAYGTAPGEGRTSARRPQPGAGGCKTSRQRRGMTAKAAW